MANLGLLQRILKMDITKPTFSLRFHWICFRFFSLTSCVCCWPFSSVCFAVVIRCRLFSVMCWLLMASAHTHNVVVAAAASSFNFRWMLNMFNDLLLSLRLLHINDCHITRLCFKLGWRRFSDRIGSIDAFIIGLKAQRRIDLIIPLCVERQNAAKSVTQTLHTTICFLIILSSSQRNERKRIFQRWDDSHKWVRIKAPTVPRSLHSSLASSPTY